MQRKTWKSIIAAGLLGVVSATTVTTTAVAFGADDDQVSAARSWRNKTAPTVQLARSWR